MTTQTTMHRVYNFSPGPAMLPLPVLEQAQRELLALPGVGSSVLEISHRSKTFGEMLEAAKEGLRQLLGIPDNYHTLFLQGGARLQFSMVAMNLLKGQERPADYVLTGSWGQKARDEAAREGPVNVPWDGQSTGYDRVPEPEQIRWTPGAAYVHITSNETIQGVQFRAEPETADVPLVCDASSDFLSRPIDIARYGLLYACAQKNAGPAGLTIVIIREDLLERSRDTLPGYLNYRTHVAHDSRYNTPPTFAVYLAGLVARWLRDEVGGLEKMHQRNRQKAEMLYEVVDRSEGFYRGHALPRDRSLMNVTFRLADESTEQRFLAEAEQRGLCNLKGHRSVGGIRASIYNAMPVEGVEALRDFMREFQAAHA